MTNTQNVTELQPRMTREQLVDAARKAAPLLPAAYGWMVNELANRLDVTSVALCEAMAQRKELAKENSALKFGVQTIHDTFTSRTDEDVFESIKMVNNLPTKATDIVAGELAADSIDAAINIVMSLVNHQVPGVVAVLNILNLHSSNLRAGVVKNG